MRLQFPRWGKDKTSGAAAGTAAHCFDFDGGSHSHSVETHWPVAGASPTGGAGIAASLAASSLCVPKPKQYAFQTPATWSRWTLWEVRPVHGVLFKQFPARDVVSRWDVIQAHGRATDLAASQFLETLLHRMPFSLRALQVDGGSEFAAEFERACQQRGLHLSVLPPRSPKRNGAVERASRTHSEEFYQVNSRSLEMNRLNRELRQWVKISNTVRPTSPRLPHSSPVPAPTFISAKRMKLSLIHRMSTG